MKKVIILILALISTLSLGKASNIDKNPSLISPEVVERIAEGKELNIESCTACHKNSVYAKEGSSIKSFDSLSKRVATCNINTGAGLDEEELENLTLFLNSHYYKFTK